MRVTLGKVVVNLIMPNEHCSLLGYGNERTGQKKPEVPAKYKGNMRCSEVVSMKGIYSARVAL